MRLPARARTVGCGFQARQGVGEEIPRPGGQGSSGSVDVRVCLSGPPSLPPGPTQVHFGPNNGVLETGAVRPLGTEAPGAGVFFGRSPKNDAALSRKDPCASAVSAANAVPAVRSRTNPAAITLFMFAFFPLSSPRRLPRLSNGVLSSRCDTVRTLPGKSTRLRFSRLRVTG